MLIFSNALASVSYYANKYGNTHLGACFIKQIFQCLSYLFNFNSLDAFYHLNWI